MKLWTVAALALPAAVAALAAPARADAPTVEVQLEPWAAFDGVDRPYRYLVSARVAGDDPVEVAFDRRLLSFEVRPAEGRGRRHRCRHPAAPRTSGRARTRTVEGDREWREWVDLRMYCWGAARRALDAGARVEARYGWRRGSRTRWVARAPGARRARDILGGVSPEPFLFPARPEEERRTRRLGDDAAASPLEVALSSRSVRTEAGLSFRVAVGAAAGSERVYVRPDAFTFLVRRPSGAVTRCSLPRGGGYPPPDLFRRVTGRARAVEALDASQFCPDDTFADAGIYEVVPKLRLEHDGGEWNLRAVTGRFVGPTSVVRVTRGENGYVDQVPRRGADAPEGADPASSDGDDA